MALFWPMLLQAALTFAVYPILLARRVAASKSGEARISRTANGFDEPDGPRRAARNVANQFEIPVLFYVACLALTMLDAVGPFAIGLAWIFAVSRIAHAFVHLGANALNARAALFAIGFASALLLWVLLAIRLLA